LEEKPALILETGTSAWGTDSSRLWASYVKSFGGSFSSVDIRPEASLSLRDLKGTVQFHVGDGVDFIKSFQLPEGFSHVNLAYLDSWDLDILNPQPPMDHGLAEFNALLPFLDTGSVIVIDDTPIEAHLLGTAGEEFFLNRGFVPGKGASVLAQKRTLEEFDVAYHHYNLVLVKK